MVSETGTSNSGHRGLIRLAVGASLRWLKTVGCSLRAVYVNMKPFAPVPQVHPLVGDTQSLSSVNIDEIFTMLGSFLYQISAPIA